MFRRSIQKTAALSPLLSREAFRPPLRAAWAGTTNYNEFSTMPLEERKAIVDKPLRLQSIAGAIGNMKALFLTNSFNSMAQRAFVELSDTYDMDIRVEIAVDEQQIADSVQRHEPDLIICPFLTKRIPKEIWANKDRPCLIVHPGIHGDRGASSIDWALRDDNSQWGVTVLQADEEMDAGDIWATKNFAVPHETTKAKLYGNQVVEAAMECLHHSLRKIVTGEEGTPLDYRDPNVKGRLRPNMKISERTVNFQGSSKEAVDAIRFSDSAPGAPCEINGHKVFVYNVYEDTNANSPSAPPGTITGKLFGAVRVACGEGSIWITHMKGRGKNTSLPTIKLPATDILPEELIANIPTITDVLPLHDVHSEIENGVAMVHFPFLNGAMSTEQCERLTSNLKQIFARPDVKIVVLAGGESSWSNGINLNTIERADDPEAESWRNINAINDVVKAIFTETEKVTIAALRGNAGAGGAMAALACDFVWAHEGIVLNPHYKTMGLHGSEYWTYFLPRRVGMEKAKDLTDRCMPVSAKGALDMGMIDDIISRNRTGFMDEVGKRCSGFVENESLFKSIVDSKQKKRTPEWLAMLQRVREHELNTMRINFGGHEYIQAREAFVYKRAPNATPSHLVQHVYDLNTKKKTSLPVALEMNGKKLARKLKTDLAMKVKELQESVHGQLPSLAVLIVNGNNESEKYVGKKIQAARKVGIQTQTHRFEESDDTVEQQLIDRVEVLNHDPNVNGIIIQLPLPDGVDTARVLGMVDPRKDVDGFISTSLGQIAGGVPSVNHDSDCPNFVPCTARAVLALLDHHQVRLQGKTVCVIGRSRIVGMPTTLLLMQRGATVTNCDIHTTSLDQHVRQADVVVAAAGSPELVRASWLKPGCVVVDVGVNVISSCQDEEEAERSSLVGDVHADAKHVASMVTPVPGGVGPMTVAMLLENTVEAFAQQNGLHHK